MKMKRYKTNENIIAGTTLRDRGQAEDNNMALHACVNYEAVIENRENLATQMDCALTDFVCAHQTHSANVYKVTNVDKGRGATQAHTAIPDVDALYTDEPNLLLCTFTADCVPVIFYNENNGIIGVIHSGWQGTVKEITRKVFKQLANEEQSSPADWHVHIGMALSQEKFEVDEDVYSKFQALGYADEFMYFNDATNKYHIDNQRTVKKQLELAGVPAERITVDQTCTYVSEDGFSYRQDKKAGRHLSFIMRKE